MELRLKLRTLLARKKTEQFIKYNSLSDDNEYQEKKSQEKKKAIENFQKRKAEKNL